MYLSVAIPLNEVYLYCLHLIPSLINLMIVWEPLKPQVKYVYVSPVDIYEQISMYIPDLPH